MAVAHRFAEKARTNDVLIAETVDFAGLCLSDSILHGLKNSGFERPSPIQLKAIPLGRCGLDLIVQAKSGTGKTCVFSVIALESIEVSTSSTQVLVLAPTREIAIQIWEVINSLGSALPDLQCHTFIGGLPLHEDKKKLRLCHIAVGTPGRIQSLIEQGCLKTSSIRLFVLDEADKLLEECFQEQVNWIYSALPENKQILALSATYPEYMANHLTIYMRNPTFIRLNISDLTLLGIKQYFACVASHPLPHRVFEAKTAMVVKLLSSISFDQCLIFSNMQTRAQNLENELTSQGWPTTCIAGSLDQKDRISAMAKLKAYKCRVLISTDLTSRGIDADQVNLIINLDVPKDHETYLHRIGRAGRFGSYGAGVTVVSEGQELLDLHAIEHKISAHIQSLPDPIPDDLVKQQLQVNLDDVVTTKVLVTRSQPEKQLLPDENKTKVHEDATTPLVMAEKRADDNLPSKDSKEAFHIQNAEDSVYSVCQADAEISFQDSSVDTCSVGILEQYTTRSGCAESLDDYGCLSQHSDAAPDCAPIVQLDNNTISKNTSSQDSNGENSVDINSEDISGSKVNTDLLGIVDKGYSLNQDQAQETDGQENSLVLNFISLQGNQSNEGEEVTGTNDTNSQENGSSVHSYLAALVPTGNDGVCSDIPVAQSEILKMNRGKHPECEHESGQSTDSTRPNENKLDKLNDKVGKLETEEKASKEFGSSSSLQKSAVLKKYFNAFATADGWSTMLNSDAEVPASRRGINDVGEQSPKTHQNRKENGRKDKELSWESELEMYISARSKVNKDLNDDIGEDLGSHKATNMNRPKIQAKRKLGVGHSSVRQCKEEKDLNKPSVKESELETVPQQVHLSPRNGFTLTRASLPPQDSGRIVKDGKETVVNDYRQEDFNTSKDCIIKASKWRNGTDGKKITALSKTDEKWGCTTSEAVGETHETGTESVTDFLENSSLLFSLRNLGTRAKESNKNSSLLNYSSALQDYEKYLEESTKPVILTAHEFVQKTLKAKKTMDQNHLKQISNFLDHFHSSLKEKSHQTNNALPLQHDTKNSVSEIRQDFGQKLLSNGPEVHAAEISQNGNSLWDGGDRLLENGYTGTPLPETINPQPIAFSSNQIEVRQDIELNLPEKPLSKRSVDSDQKTKAKAERPQRYRPMAVCGPATEHLFNFRFKASEICLPASEDIAVSDGLELIHSEMDNQEKQEIRKQNGSFTPCFDQIQLSLNSENHIPVLTATKEVEDTAYEDMNFTIPCISDQSQSRGKTYTTAVTSLNEASDDSSENSSSVSSLSASGEGNTSEEVKNKNPICFQNYYVDESAVRKGNGKPSPKPLMTKRVCNEHTGKKLDSVPSAPIQTASTKPPRKQAQSACPSHHGKDFKLNSAVPATHHFQGSEKNYHNCYNTVTETPAFWPDYTWPYSHYMAVPYSQIAQPTSLPRRTWQQYTTSPSYLQNFPVQYHDRNCQQYLHPSSSEYPHPSSTGYLHPSSTRYPHPSSTAYPHPSSTGYLHTYSTGYPYPSSTGYPHLSSTRYPHPSSTGYPHLSSIRYPHPSSTGYLHTYSTGYPHPSSTRYPHPTSSGAGARHMYTSQQLAENLAETHRVQVESLQIYIRKMAKFYATFCQRER